MIRLTRVGKKKHPTYRVVVQQKQKAPSSNVLEILGHYDPHTNPATVEVKAERLSHWISKGAQLSDTMHNLMVSKGLVKGEKRRIVPEPKPVVEEAPAAVTPTTPAEKTETADSAKTSAKEPETTKPSDPEQKVEAPIDAKETPAAPEADL